jgi:DNA-binding CsgD family transcriptional regulator
LAGKDGTHEVAREIHEGVFRLPLETFKESALALLRRAIPFDSSIWGSGSEQPQLVFGIAAYGFPLARLIDYAQHWQPEDRLRAACAAEPGQSLRNEDLAPIEEYRRSPIYQGFCRPSGIEHAIGNAQIDSATNVGELVFLFRASRGAFFSDAERDALNALMPHLVAAWRHRLLLHMREHVRNARGGGDSMSSGYAVVDNDGRVHASDTEFSLRMRAAFPSWVGPLLPFPVVQQLKEGRLPKKARDLRLTIRRGAGRHLVSFASAADPRLSAAELRVALLFAGGKTAAAVARELRVSPLTARNQLSSVYAKLGVHTKLELARALKEL